jgi:hypothetical protein
MDSSDGLADGEVYRAHEIMTLPGFFPCISLLRLEVALSRTAADC